MTHQALVHALWERMEARAWHAVPELLHADFSCDWPLSNERIRGADNFVAVNQNYPGDWHIRILRLIADSEGAASEVAVDIDGHTEVASSFYTFADGKILHVTEYWGEAYEAPAWRKQWTEKLKP